MDFRMARSLTGPGKPYWKRPHGSTGAKISFAVRIGPPGRGIGGDVVVGWSVVVGVVMLVTFRAVEVEYIAAVAAAPTAAPAAAIRANVVFDMMF